MARESIMNSLHRFALVFIFLFFDIIPIWAETYCVSTVNELNIALFDAQSNDQDDIINIVQGVYLGSFVYSSSEDRKLSVHGGYNSGCTYRILNPYNTTIDAEEKGPCLVLNCTSNGDFEVQGIGFKNGIASSNNNGGGMWIYSDEGVITIESNFISNNFAELAGNGIFINGASSTILKNNTVKNGSSVSSPSNSSRSSIYIASSSVDCEDNYVVDNTTRGFYLRTGGLSFRYNTVVRNNAGGEEGGGCYISATGGGGNFYFLDNLFNGNYAKFGGGIAFYDRSNMNIYLEGNKLYANDAIVDGGGIYIPNYSYNTVKDVYILNNVFFENCSGYDGYAIYLEDIQSIAISNNTFAKNKTLLTDIGNGGALYVKHISDTQYSNIYNNIFWNNSASTCSDIYLNDDGNSNYVYSQVNIYNNNFDHSEEGFCIPHFFPIDLSNLNKEDPLFADYSNNCYLLDEFSPCIDTGTDWADAPDTDIDGIYRPIGTEYDMGAYESIYSCEINDIKFESAYFSNFYSFLDSVAADCSIYCHAVTIEENIDFNKDYNINLKGGYTCDFSTNSLQGYNTTIHGLITISNGSVNIENIIVQ